MVVAEFPDAEKPDTVPVRSVSRHEWAAAVVACLHAAGYPGASEVGAGLAVDSGTVPDAQREAFVIANYVCEMQYPVHDPVPRDLDASQVAVLYAYFVDRLRVCVQEHGVAVSEAPSLEVFRETFNQPEGWNPLNEVPPARWEAVASACEQYPDGL
jgi:hypothetical protein